MAQSQCINYPTILTGKLFIRANSPPVSPNSYRTFISSKFSRGKLYAMVISASSSASTVSGESPISLVLTKSERNNELVDTIKSSRSNCLSETHLDLAVPGLQSKTRGKVRDIYGGGDYLVLVTTDRQSTFDRVLASIPFKGQVLK